MTGTLQCVVLDCPDVLKLAHFYQTLLGGEINREDPRWSVDEDWATLHTPQSVILAFQRADDYLPPRWPDPSRPQQFHLDIGVADLDRAEEEALALGATPLEADDRERGFRVYADPVGHPFCLVREAGASGSEAGPAQG